VRGWCYDEHTMRARSAIVATFVAAALVPTPSHAQSDADQNLPVDVLPDDAYADSDPSALSDFGPALDPYGTWGDDPTYGTVWTPSVDQMGSGFQPFDTAGSWTYVDGDFVWVSDYAWGSICFHYGRWASSGGRWIWIPGREYAGAWVSWRVGDDAYGYVGWAPMAPTWRWIGGNATALGLAPSEPWAFSTYNEFLSPNLSSHVVTGAVAAAAASHTRPYVAAQPTAGPGRGSLPAPHGPPPALLGIEVSRLALPVLSTRELRARQLARPLTAQQLGARPPVRRVVRATPQPVSVPGRPAGATHGPTHGRR
jgi:hypothetical protein